MESVADRDDPTRAAIAGSLLIELPTMRTTRNLSYSFKTFPFIFSGNQRQDAIRPKGPHVAQAGCLCPVPPFRCHVAATRRI